MARDSNQPIIIKKKRRGHHGGHHGGAWKVAYADFVTAMMAFFLLLWLLNSTTKEQLQGIADYFSPNSVSESKSGSGGIFGGTTLTAQGPLRSDNAPVALAIPVPGTSNVEFTDDGTMTEAGPTDEDNELDGTDGGPTREESDELSNLSPEELKKFLAEQEEKQFAQAEAELRQAIQSVPELAVLAENIVVDRTPEGLRIQLVDQQKISMFPLASAQMNEQAQDLMKLVAGVVSKLPNRLSISGHTDSLRFNRQDGYGNWELSTDRANASRRVLTQAGVAEERFATVVGKADRDPLFPDDPKSPQNRRISIVLLRENPVLDPVPSEE